MLIDFTVSNFRSIKEPQTLSMLATSIKEHPENVMDTPDPEIKLLKTAVIYGANGSGKSNLLKALEAFSNFVYYSNDIKLGEKIKYYEQFRLDSQNANLPTAFIIEFFGRDDIRYKYIVSISNNEIETEALYFYPRKQEARLFYRLRGMPIVFGDGLLGAKKSIESKLLSNQLFLSKAANNNHEQLGNIYSNLWNLIHVFSPSPKNLLNFITSHLKVNAIKGDENFRNKLSALLSFADTGIEEVLTVKTDIPGNYEIKINHSEYINKIKAGTVSFSIEDESEGSQRLYAIGGQILLLLNRFHSSIFIDELNNSFHPLMTEMLIKMFYNKATNPYNSQLIFTTHDTSLLSSGLFRRDQIWFTEKDQYGATQLYSLSEFDKDKVRPDIPFDKWYLSGRFGALPLIKDFNFKDNATAKKAK